MTKTVLMNVIEHGEMRVATLEDGDLAGIHLERSEHGSLVGNIYKARVQTVKRSLEAAFVELGLGRNGFLRLSDAAADVPADAEPAEKGKAKEGEKPARRRPRRRSRGRRAKAALREGQQIIIQVTRDGIGGKGPSVTTHLSLPGRYLVLMPGVKKLGISKKITDEKQRADLRKMLANLDPPENMGFIVRTAGLGRSVRDLRRDMDHLLKLWKGLERSAKRAKAPYLVWRESDLAVRAVRDMVAEDVDEILVDSADVRARIAEAMKQIAPSLRRRVKLYDEKEPLFHRYGVEEEIAKLCHRKVTLASGGSVVIEETEALVAIDVNTAKFRGGQNMDEAILRTNVEAAREIARQLRLRDVGGLVIIDFIDMEPAGHRRKVEEALREALKTDRARLHVTPVSSLGVVEMTRQRRRTSLGRSLQERCPTYRGTGFVKSAESVGFDFIRQVKAAASNGGGRIEARLAPACAADVANRYRRALVEIEEHAGTRVVIRPDPLLAVDEIRVERADGNPKGGR